MRAFRLPAAVLAVLALTFAPPSRAGQVRVNVANFSFSPRAVTVNLGDHVVWVWTGGSHTVTSGDSATSFADGAFGFTSLVSGATYSWKSSGNGAYPYYCVLHAPSMAGHVFVTSFGATGLSDFRISEVQWNDPANHGLVELTNLGAAGNLGKYRVKVSGFPVQTLAVGASTDIAVAGSGAGRVVLHCGVSGANTTTDFFLPAITQLPANGSVALYVPNTVAPSLTDASQLIDYVEWGAPAQESEALASGAGFWTAGQAPTNVAAGHSIAFCGLTGQYGPNFWSEVGTPTFGSGGDCTTPTIGTTWGRIKALYR